MSGIPDKRFDLRQEHRNHILQAVMELWLKSCSRCAACKRILGPRDFIRDRLWMIMRVAETATRDDQQQNLKLSRKIPDRIQIASHREYDENSSPRSGHDSRILPACDSTLRCSQHPNEAKPAGAAATRAAVALKKDECMIW
ncbi:uncharacterized protein LOC129753462 [Uranotaenia lowii]|uniref:uncharacterized protein LOC129739420 n=1 Tax=Uranotaenia lowii TaxID=190385 RepID=UPI002478AA62|nr:uncharacterized protein LOC129739420 [Uranotaenia lowii]XP_055586846.1 uncharacterized protein LOC129739420 [Uranotaenia lowii]XP_055586847.1 uncharacterized protein LOC129739420 [Uranotaenia lowii]XP_055605280.1 uncharacterized protein LOC129753462 [Uranotaenia lowii]XP_055605340.1 uncharacterized protein LOC129753462 [Uranotaenia lowii]XP_055605410.1 uncharacterized protein LOC129753462 [Uranotaenia lowii]XP_055605473.1 uncharacterized protein LOC129753462 [Uranotaenia lowii]